MRLNATTRAKALVAEMTLQEKASNMDSFNFGVPRLGVPPNSFSEALHGICSGCGRPFNHTITTATTTTTTEATTAMEAMEATKATEATETKETKLLYTSTGCPTAFPQVISMGATWNRSLWTAVGQAVSDETRGLYSQGSEVGWESALFLWAPNINPFRDPRWGRGQEVVSEEPMVCAEYAATYIPALQGEYDLQQQQQQQQQQQFQHVNERGGDNRAHAGGDTGTPPHTESFLKTVATAKHYFDYDLEGVPGGPTSRQNIDVNVSLRDQTEYFTPPFKAAVERGRTQSIMCSYNAVNGVPACFHGDMINGVLRNEWGFDGFVVSDCDALSDGASHHYITTHFNGSLQVQAQQAIRGGTDLNCGSLYGEQNVAAVRAGLIREDELDTSLVRVWSKAFRLGVVDQGLPDNPSPWSKLGAEAVDTPAHRSLALEAALQGIVLLKNDGSSDSSGGSSGDSSGGGDDGGGEKRGKRESAPLPAPAMSTHAGMPRRLPLSPARVKKLALIGPHANGACRRVDV